MRLSQIQLGYNLERAPCLGNLFLGRRAERMRVNSQLAGQFAIAKDFDRVGGAANETMSAEQFRRYRFAGWKNIQFFQVDDRVAHAKRIVKTALGHAAMQRHLAAFKATTARIATAGLLSLVAGAGS